MVGCGNMDGKITTSVESTQLPAKDDEANFGKGYGYQFGADEMCIRDRGITVSSRESASFRNGIVKIAATKVSAGVSTYLLYTSRCV